MAAKISDEVKTFFLGDATGLVTATAKANAALDSNAKRERMAAVEAKRAYDSRASSIKNALVNPAGAATDGLNKLVQGMKLSALTTGVLGAGIALAGEKFADFRAEALAARKETEQFAESFRRMNQGNKLVSGAEDASSLVSRLTATKEQEQAIKQRNFDLNPPDHSLALAGLRARYLVADPVHAEANHEQDKLEARNQLTGNEQDQLRLRQAIAESLGHETDAIKEQLKGSGEQLRITGLQLARTREIRALEGTDANNPANLAAINERYDLQIAKEKNWRNCGTSNSCGTRRSLASGGRWFRTSSGG